MTAEKAGAVRPAQLPPAMAMPTISAELKRVKPVEQLLAFLPSLVARKEQMAAQDVGVGRLDTY